jgi:hypothetical protein
VFWLLSFLGLNAWCNCTMHISSTMVQSWYSSAWERRFFNLIYELLTPLRQFACLKFWGPQIHMEKKKYIYISTCRRQKTLTLLLSIYLRHWYISPIPNYQHVSFHCFRILLHRTLQVHEFYFNVERVIEFYNFMEKTVTINIS